MMTGVQKLSPSSGYNHMHRHLLSGSMGKKKENVHMAIFSLGGIVYLAIPGCIRCVNSDYFKFDKVYFQSIVRKIVKPFDKCVRIHIAKLGDELLTRVV